MDRPVPDSVRRKRFVGRTLIAALVLAALILASRVISGFLQPTVHRSAIRTAIVDRGPIEATISARGHVTPEHEHLITSPIDTRVTAILKVTGEEVAKGDAIVLLDVNESELARQKLEDQIALKRNERLQAELALETKLGELEGEQAIKKLELKSFEFQARRDRQLADRGIISEDEARKSEIDAERARIELEQLRARMESARRSLAVKVNGLDLEISVLEKDKDEVTHRLELATAKSDRRGVVTWVVPSEGAAIRRGDEIARVADLSSFRVDATVADVHAQRLAPGQRVMVENGDLELDGKVSRIHPTVENGMIAFEVALAEPDHALLRHNLRVDVYVVTEEKDDAVRVRRGAYTMRDGTNAVFVIRNDAAFRTPVRFGITNFETYEVVAGLDPGNEVIISDMSDYMHAKEVKLR